MKQLVPLCVMVFLAISSQIQAQGCVAIRSQSCAGNIVTGSNQAAFMGSGDILGSIGYRYFRSFRHFRGSHEEAHRIEEGSEVINKFNGIDLGLSYGITDRWSATLIAPIMIQDRSSLYEHDRQNRYHTQSAGLGDIRLTANYWVLPHESKGNIALGATIKFPTGKQDVMDEFHKLDDDGSAYTITQPVDQSIQLGDGAFGLGLEVQGFQPIANVFSLYYNASYLSTPRNVNNTLRRVDSDPNDIFNYFSCPDQYAARVGFLAAPWHSVTVGFGGRVEGIPSSDLFGKSEGYRRPGYAVSVEPGVSVLMNRFAFSLNVPIAVYRNRVQSTQDILRSTPDNIRNGDAAFADYVVNATVTYLLSGAAAHMPMEHFE